MDRASHILSLSAEIVGCRRLCNKPGLIQSLHHVLWQRALLQIPQVTLELREVRHTDYHAIVSSFCPRFESRMMDDPSQCNLQEGEVMFLGHRFNQLERLKGRILKVSFAIHRPHSLCLVGKATFIGDNVLGFDLAGEDTASERVVDDNVDVVFPAARNQLRLNGTRYNMA